MIPFEYNYYLAISLYSKLRLYQEEIKKLHQKNQPGIYTFSNIITKGAKYGANGLDIQKGFFVLRSIDDNIESYLRLGLSVDPYLKIVESIFKVKTVTRTAGRLDNVDSANFRTLSPVLVRNFESKKLFVTEAEDVERNLNSVMKWVLKNQFGMDEDSVSSLGVSVSRPRPKSVRISSSPVKESITRAFEFSGRISGDSGVLQVLYHKGLGSKTGLGLGCWEIT